MCGCNPGKLCLNFSANNAKASIFSSTVTNVSNNSGWLYIVDFSALIKDKPFSVSVLLLLSTTSSKHCSDIRRALNSLGAIDSLLVETETREVKSAKWARNTSLML